MTAGWRFGPEIGCRGKATLVVFILQVVDFGQQNRAWILLESMPCGFWRLAAFVQRNAGNQ